MPLCDVENQHTCVNCYTAQGPCDGLQEFLNELTELTYKHKIALCVTQQSGDSIAAIPLSEADPDGHGPRSVEVINGSGFIQF